MPQRKTNKPTLAPANLTNEQKVIGIQRLRARLEEVKAFDTTELEKYDDKVDALEVGIEETLDRVFGHETTDFMRYAAAKEIDDTSGYIFGDDRSVAQYRDDIRKGVRKSAILLAQAIRGLEDDLKFAGWEVPGDLPNAARKSRKIFIVHGRDEEYKEKVARFLEKVEFEPIILHERPNKGRTIISKFQEEAQDVGFAIVIMTPDDQGGLETEPTHARARQNVIFELGFFIGRLGIENVSTLVKGAM